MRLPATAFRIALLLVLAPLAAFAEVAISINIAAPPERLQNESRPGEAGPRDRQQREQRADSGPKPELRQHDQH